MSIARNRIVYVVGCGRSGTTLLGFALGNSIRTLDLGEVLDFARFRGHPNGFAAGSDNYTFWNSVLCRVSQELGKVDFDRLAGLQREVDSHESFLPLAILGSAFRRKELSEYRRFLEVLYGCIQKEAAFDVLIDSSKYPSRLLHLRSVFRDEGICVIHIMRNPVELAHAMQNPEQSKSRSFLQAMMYFFAINVFSIMATRGLGQDRCLRINYEELVSQPEKMLERIGLSFAIDTGPAIEKIRRGEPLDRGYVFNGNRMRMQDKVVFRKSSGSTRERSLSERAFEQLARFAFGPGSSGPIHHR